MASLKCDCSTRQSYERWKLKKSIDKDHNVYVRNISGAKVKCMKEYVKPCL